MVCTTFYCLGQSCLDIHGPSFVSSLPFSQGDKGGSSTKLAMQMVNQVDSNSKDGTNLLAMFDAPDTSSNMQKVYGIYQEQFADIQEKGEVQVEGEIKKLRTMLYGDYEALCKTLGHMGPSSSFPCIWCNITLAELRDTKGIGHCPKMRNNKGEWVDNMNWPSQRTVGQYIQDLADLEEHRRRGGRKVTGASFHSINGKPLIPIVTDMNHVIPPSLHILLGLVVRYYKLLELECRKLDNNGQLTDADLAQYDEWQEASENAKVAEVEKVEAEASLGQEEELLNGMEKAKRGKTKGLCNEACSMPLCALTASSPESVNGQQVEWIKCTECGLDDESGWFHAYCVGIQEDQVGSSDLDSFACPICRGEISDQTDTLRIQRERVSASKALVNSKLVVWNAAKEQLDAVYKDVCARHGSIEKELNRVLEDVLHVKRQAYHSQCFVGNHCKTILDKKDILLNVIPQGEVQVKFRGLFGRLKGIVDLFVGRFLSDKEVSELCTRCWELGSWFPQTFPTETIPPKLHFLICHIPECAQRWRTIGLLSEHGLEAIHADINSIERVYRTVRDTEVRMKLMVGTLQQQASVNKSSLKANNRTVRRCSQVDVQNRQCVGRYRKTNVANERECSDCDHRITF